MHTCWLQPCLPGRSVVPCARDHVQVLHIRRGFFQKCLENFQRCI